MDRLIIMTVLFASTVNCAVACSCASRSESELERLDRNYASAATVAIMRVVDFEVTREEELRTVTNLQIEYVFKETEVSQPPYRGRGAYSATYEGTQVVSSCDVKLKKDELVVAFADAKGQVRFGGCYPASAPINFNTLPRLYELKGGKVIKPADGT